MSCNHEFHWYLAINEDGWRCCLCDYKPGEPPGFDPKLDREDIYSKVYGVLSELHEAGFVHVSNGSAGDGISASVADRCESDGLYDQHSILRFIIEGMQPSHAEYWREVSEGILAGKDPRDRCPCGALSRSSSLTDGVWRYRCLEHWGIDADSDVPGYQAPLFPEAAP